MTIEEIDKFVDRLMDETPGEDYVQRLGRKNWHLLQKLADSYGCPTCRPGFQKLVNVDHNTVNIHLGKPVVNPELYEEGIALVFEAYKKYHHHHPRRSVAHRSGHSRHSDPTVDGDNGDPEVHSHLKAKVSH